MEQEISIIQTPINEQETHINIDYSTKRAHVYTSKAGVARRLLDLLNEHGDGEVVLEYSNEFGLEISVPIDWVSVKPRKKYEISEEQRKIRAERLAAARQAKKELIA